MIDDNKKVYINCFGRLSIKVGREDKDMEINSGKARELIAFLMTYKGGAVSKDTVCGALWGNTRQENSRDSLYKLVKKIKDMGLPILIDCQRNVIRMKTDNIISDLFEFEALTGQIRNMNIVDMEKAVNIYKGPLFEEECYEWIENKAAIYDRKYLEILCNMVSYYQENNSVVKAKFYQAWMKKRYGCG